jgi:hypothetical protein
MDLIRKKTKLKGCFEKFKGQTLKSRKREKKRKGFRPQIGCHLAICVLGMEASSKRVERHPKSHCLIVGQCRT